MIVGLTLSVLLIAASPSVKPVSGEVLCRVQHALRPHRPMPEATCQGIADAANATFAPRLTIAIAILESDFREDALARRARGVYDTGLMGIRCRMAHGIDRTTRAMWKAGTGKEAALDLECDNWPIQGVTLRELLDSKASIRAAEQIMLDKRKRSPKRWLQLYNGGLQEHGYADRIRAIEGAVFRGRRRVLPVRSWKDERANKLTAKIVKAGSDGRDRS